MKIVRFCVVYPVLYSLLNNVLYVTSEPSSFLETFTRIDRAVKLILFSREHGRDMLKVCYFRLSNRVLTDVHVINYRINSHKKKIPNSGPTHANGFKNA